MGSTGANDARKEAWTASLSLGKPVDASLSLG
jgi:hypothetical protein